MIGAGLLVAFLALTMAAPGAKEGSKSCPKIDEFVELNLDKYGGKKWYNVYRPSKIDYQCCVTYKYEMDKNEDKKQALFLKKTYTYKYNDTTTPCFDTDNIELAILRATEYNGTIFAYQDLYPLIDHAYNYTILATDYDSYSIEYRCEDGDGPEVWVYSKEQQLSSENEKLVQHSLKLRGLPALEDLDKLKHEDCTTPEQKCPSKKIK